MKSNLGLILDVSVKVRVELGSVKMLVKDLLNLQVGSAIELDSISGEPLNVYANDRLIARGEVITMGEKYGIRIKEIIGDTNLNEEVA